MGRDLSEARAGAGQHWVGASGAGGDGTCKGPEVGLGRVVAEAEEEGGTQGWWGGQEAEEGLRIILSVLHTSFILSRVS